MSMKSKKGAFVGWLVFAAFLEFIICHMCASAIQSGYFMAIFEFGFLEHIRMAPFDLFYFDANIYLFSWLIFFVLLFMGLSKIEPPKAELKGVEHGSSHFMSREERKEFLKTCVTPVLKDEDIDIVRPFDMNNSCGGEDEKES